MSDQPVPREKPGDTGTPRSSPAESPSTDASRRKPHTGRAAVAHVARAAARDSIPIALGYFTVALAVGVFAAQIGLATWLAGLMSATSLSSSGQFAGLTIIRDAGSYLQLALGVGLVNLRYVLMAVSLGQRLGPEVGALKRAFLAWGITDEIYALGMARRTVGFADYAASMVLPILGWTAGTVVGAVVGGVLPPVLNSAFGVLLYAMFVAIVVPGTRTSRPVLGVVLGAAALGSVLYFVPWLDSGWRIIVVTVVVSAVAATVAPHPGDDSGADDAATEDDTGHSSEPATHQHQPPAHQPPAEDEPNTGGAR